MKQFQCLNQKVVNNQKYTFQIPGGLLGLKIPDLAVDSKGVNFQIERKRMGLEKKQDSIEFKLKEYQKNASLYTTSIP